MAKVSGALFSMDASGGFGGALVFGKWKGRQTVRQLVTPANPQSLSQQNARNAIRVLGAVQRFIRLTNQQRSGETLSDQEELQAAAPGGQAWNGYLVKSGIGAGALNYTAARAAFAALTATEKTAWETAAGAVVPAYGAVAQKTTGGATSTAITRGEVHFIGQYALWKAGVAPAAPGAVPPTYA